jgi:hypothetical protein
VTVVLWVAPSSPLVTPPSTSPHWPADPAFSDWPPDLNDSFTEWYDDAIVPNLPHAREYYLAQLELMDAEMR